jgi:uncharacterized repeat protein (TIGR03803 family)
MKLTAYLAVFAVWAGPALAASQFSTIYAFQGDADGDLPNAVTVGSDGTLYGTTSGGGMKDQGTIFKLSAPAVPGAAWTKETLYAFKPSQSGRPYSRVIFDQDTGALLGAASGQEGGQHMGTIFRLVPPSGKEGEWTYTVIHDFMGGSDGDMPYSDLTQDPATGTVYGASLGNFEIQADLGTVFGFTPNASHTAWTRTLNHVFTGGDGASPKSGVALGTNGVLYGTTAAGGAGNGKIFSLDPATGVLTTLFQSQGGSDPYLFTGGVPALSEDGLTIFDTSEAGAPTHCNTDRVFVCGTVFSIPADGSTAPTVLAKLAGKKTGEPMAGLIWNRTHTTFYVSTFLGPPNACKFQGRHFGCGAVFKLALRNGKWKYTLVHAFDGADGQNPLELAFGTDGTLYGVAANGGAGKAGTVFAIGNP